MLLFSTFTKLPFVIKIFILSFFEWPLKTGLTVVLSRECSLMLSIKKVAYIMKKILRFSCQNCDFKVILMAYDNTI